VFLLDDGVVQFHHHGFIKKSFFLFFLFHYIEILFLTTSILNIVTSTPSTSHYTFKLLQSNDGSKIYLQFLKCISPHFHEMNASYASLFVDFYSLVVSLDFNIHVKPSDSSMLSLDSNVHVGPNDCYSLSLCPNSLLLQVVMMMHFLLLLMMIFLHLNFVPSLDFFEIDERELKNIIRGVVEPTNMLSFGPKMHLMNGRNFKVMTHINL
jgi:hypothetical protein